MPRIGVLGGTFDPVHRAHLGLARLFGECLALDEIRIIPAGSPWQKDQPGASHEARLAMLRLAVAETRLDATIDTRELDRDGPTYTVETLRALRAEIGDAPLLVLLVGADQLEGLHTWSRWREIFALASLAVAARTGFDWAQARLDPAVGVEISARSVDGTALPQSLDARFGQVALVHANLGPTSSSQIREQLRLGRDESVRDLVPSDVMDYIRVHHLYRD
jgi:nicotinate-nucleotide adenylyltransferase